MNLGEGPQFIAVEVDLATINKLRSALMGKFHLDSDFFKQSSQDPSQRHIIFRLAAPIYPQHVASINEVSASGNFSCIDDFVHLGRCWMVLMERLLHFVR